MIEREQIISAYRLLLGREPESEPIVNHLSSLPDLAALGQMLITTDEFRRRASVGDFPQRREQWVCAEIRNGLRLWLDLMDLGVGAGALRDDWERSETAFILSHLEAGEGFIDVGANIGWFTVLAAEKVGPEGHVYAFEPRRDLFRRLRDSVAANGMLERCTLLNVALGASRSQMPIASNPDEFNPGHSFLVRNDENMEGMPIDTVLVERLDSIDVDHEITLMKIDVEGAEAMVLSGATGLIKRDHPFLIAEFFPEWLRKVSGVEPRAYLDLLRDLDYRLFELTDTGLGAAVPELPSGATEPGFFTNLVATPENKPFRVFLPSQRISQTPAVDAVMDTSIEGVYRQIARLSGEIRRFEQNQIQSFQQVRKSHATDLRQIQQDITDNANHSREIIADGLGQIQQDITDNAKQSREIIAGLEARTQNLARQSEKIMQRLERRSIIPKVLREIRRPFTVTHWLRKREKMRSRRRARKLRRVVTRAPEQGGWSEVQSRRSATKVLAGVDRPIVMIIDDRLPEPDRDSGSLDAVNMVSCLVDCGYHVIFAVCTTRRQDPRYIEEVRYLGAYPLEDQGAEPVQAFIEAYAADIDLFILNRVGAGGQFFELIRDSAPDAKVVFNSVDLHYIREARAARLAGDDQGLARSERTRDREEFLAGRSDMTYVVSSVEEEILQASVPGCATMVLPLSRDIRKSERTFSERRGLGFIGGFEHRPNIDAIRYFLEEIWPHVYQLEPDIQFQIVGSDLPDDTLKGVTGNIVYLGPLPEVESWFDNLRMTVAPLRIGAGAKGKVASSLCNGVPVILSEIAAEGMSLNVGRDVLVGRDPVDFAKQIVRLHNDPVLWAELAANSLVFAGANLSVDNFKTRVRNSLIQIDLPAMSLDKFSG